MIIDKIGPHCKCEPGGEELNVDPFTGRAPSVEAIRSAKTATTLFSHVVRDKKRRLRSQYNNGEMSRADYYKTKFMIWMAERDNDLPENREDDGSN